MAMRHPLPPKTRKDFDIAIICALQLEADAVESFFDRFWDEEYGKAAGDNNAYRTGVIANHNVVLTYMPGIGKAHTARVAANFKSSFQAIRLALIVGICGGVPEETGNGIYLGDIVISDEILTYDFGKMYPGGFQRKETVASSSLHSEVPAFLRKLRSPEGRRKLLGKTSHHLTELQAQSEGYHCPGRRQDQLFQPTYHHKHHGSSKCKRCKKNEPCKKAQESTCETLNCDPTKLIRRSRKNPNGIDIHFGRIASGDIVMKSGVERDRIAKEDTVIAFEMEGAGVCGSMPFIVIKGVCDYADSHKNKKWQKHTAGAAAACMRSLLEQWAPVDYGEDRIKDLLHEEPVCTPVARSDIQSIRGDEGYYSQNNSDGSDGEITQALPRIESCFKSTLAYFKKHLKCLPRDARVVLRQTLKTQRVIFSENAKRLLTDPSQSYDDHQASSNKVYLQAALEIEQKLEQIQRLTEHLPVATEAEEQLNSAVQTPLENAVEDLQSLTQVFASSIPQTSKPLPRQEQVIIKAATGRRQFQHFHIVQQAACSLYDALGTACNSHTVHNVHLSLKPDLDQTSTRVRFDVAFTKHSMQSESAVWINVETTIKSVETTPDHISTLTTTSISSLKRQSSQSENDLCSSKVRKSVRFQNLTGSTASPHPVEPFTALPNLSLQRNFCKVVERSLHQEICNGCIGLLGENEICKHLAYLGNKTSNSSTPTTLSQLVALSSADHMKEMGTYERVRLARYLATAVLYYHATPWLEKAWSSDDVYFFNDFDISLQQRQQILPYMTASVQGPTSSTLSQPQSPDYHHIIHNPVLFGLGVMFLELAFQAPLRALQRPVDLERGKTPGFADYFTAHRVVEQSHSKVSTSFKKIIRQCLRCDFGQGSDFTTAGLQQAFYKDVIAVLEDLEELFRDLQIE